MSQRQVQAKLAAKIHLMVKALIADLAVVGFVPSHGHHVSFQASIQEAIEQLGDRDCTGMRSRYQSICTLCWQLALTGKNWAHGWALRRVKVLTDHNLDPQDIVQEMLIGLFHAAWSYNPASGARFLTYASHKAIVRALRVITASKPVHLPEWKFAQAKMLRKMRDEHPELSDAELAAIAGVTLAHVQTSADLTAVSLDAPARQRESSVRLHEVLPNGRDIEAEIAEADLARRVKVVVDRAVDNLPPQHRLVLSARIGRDGQEVRTLRAIADDLGLCHERIRQTEKYALETISRDRGVKRLAREDGRVGQGTFSLGVAR